MVRGLAKKVGKAHVMKFSRHFNWHNQERAQTEIPVPLSTTTTHT
jgi:hypothetical protein